MRYLKYIIFTIVFIAADQITKAIFANRDFFMGPLSIHGVKNFGLSFGLNFGTGINVLVLVIAVVLFLAFLRGQKINSAITLLIAGALSNIYDRVILGYVRDFLDVGLGFTFNLADAYIFLGLVLLILSPNAKRNDTKIPDAGNDF